MEQLILNEEWVFNYKNKNGSNNTYKCDDYKNLSQEIERFKKEGVTDIMITNSYKVIDIIKID
jgi:hypothetical protein